MLSITAFNINIIMGFHKLLNESLRITNLKRIRIKTDPSCVANTEDFTDVKGYEGYILRECMGKLRVLVLAPDMPIMDIPPEMLEHINDERGADMLVEFKEYAKKYMTAVKKKQLDDPVYANIDNSSEYRDVEVFLKQNGLTEQELNDLYRGFIEHE